MIHLRAIPALLIACAAVSAAHAAPPAGAPAGTTGLCNDGSYTSTAKKQGACSSHQGVKEWYATTAGGKAGAAGKGKRAGKRSSRNPAANAPTSSTGSSAN